MIRAAFTIRNLQICQVEGKKFAQVASKWKTWLLVYSVTQTSPAQARPEAPSLEKSASSNSSKRFCALPPNPTQSRIIDSITLFFLQGSSASAFCLPTAAPKLFCEPPKTQFHATGL